MSSKCALVTGGVKRIGAAISKRLMRSGFTVIAHYNRSEDSAVELANWAEQHGFELKLAKFDLSDINNIAVFYERLRDDAGNIDVLVNNASIFNYDNFYTMQPDVLMSTIELNCLAPVLLMQKFLTRGQTENAVCINILDQKVVNLNPDFYSYTIAKAAFGVASKLAGMAIGRSLRVNSISPGLTLTSGDQSEENFNFAQSSNPLGRGPTAEAIADGVMFLIENKSINGYNLVIDAGEHLLARTRDVAYVKNEDL